MGTGRSGGSDASGLKRLENWIRLNIPEAGDPSDIKLKPCRRIPFWWIPGNRHVEGLTLWRTIYVIDRKWPIDSSNLQSVEFAFHELMHVTQFRRHPIFFPLKYLIDHLRYGYWNNPAEIEARERSRQLAAAYFLELPQRSQL